MKNIHVLPTDKPSRLYYNKNGRITFSLCETEKENTPLKPCYNIYITSYEEIKEGDWIFDFYLRKNTILKSKKNYIKNDIWYYKKIILTTDQDLIKDGVQAIDDEFLEWFVKNPSCEWVNFEKEHDDTVPYLKMRHCKPYKIIIPQEEPKQETLEEVELAPSFGYETREDTKSFDITTSNGKLMIAVCKEIIKWQQERMYSEEDMKEAFSMGRTGKTIEDFNIKFKNK